MDAGQAAQAIRDGKVVRVTVGRGDDDPVLLAWAHDGAALSYAIGGWSQGVREPICALGSDFLEKGYLAGKAKLEVVDRPEWLSEQEGGW